MVALVSAPIMLPHLLMTLGVLYCTPSTKGTGASKKAIMLVGVTGSIRLCQLNGRNMGTRDSTIAAKVPILGQNTTICFSSSAALSTVMIFSRSSDLRKQQHHCFNQQS